MSLALCFITSVLIKAYITLINHLTVIKLPEELSVIKLSETDWLILSCIEGKLWDCYHRKGKGVGLQLSQNSELSQYLVFWKLFKSEQQLLLTAQGRRLGSNITDGPSPAFHSSPSPRPHFLAPFG